MLYIGSHVGFKKDTQLLGSLKEALSYNANTFMFYTGAPQNTKRNNIEDGLTLEALNIMKEKNMDYSKVIVHAPYIINLCNENNFEFSVNFLTEELERVNQLGIKYLVLHPGSHVGLGVEQGVANIVKGINETLENIKDSNNVKIGCIHINDSKNDINSHKDRHENIGFGTIGFDNLISIIYNDRIKDIPKILETPYVDKKYPPYKYEIEMIRNKKFDNKLLEKIVND